MTYPALGGFADVLWHEVGGGNHLHPEFLFCALLFKPAPGCLTSFGGGWVGAGPPCYVTSGDTV